jgi:uncharacterized protein (TIGR03437 family)
VNAADLEAEALPPGTWFAIFGQNLGNSAQWTSENTFTLGGAGVTVCGIPAAVSYNSGLVAVDGATGWQLNALMPDAVGGEMSCPVAVTVNGQAATPLTVNIGSGILELFSFTSSGGALPVITHADYSLVGPRSAGMIPAQPGEAVIAWGTGDCLTPRITVQGNPAPVLSSGRVEAGLCQLNFLVPAGSGGDSQLKISTSPNAYTLSLAP